jgi:NAD(P)-dependent dehydrogenase (short-subunit alcohol dehydrogenase family)
MTLLTDKVAIVTGAADGIGRGIARMFVEEGAHVAVVDINGPAAEKVAMEVKTKSPSSIAIQCDVGDRLQIDRCVATVVETFEHIDVLVNTAIAGAPRVPFLETTEELAESMWRTGPLATMHFIQACYPHMRGRDAAVINFASGAGVSGNVGYAAYGPAKEGIRSLTKVAARELGKDGIRVNAVLPVAKTRLLQDWVNDMPEVAAATERAIPLRRFGDPDRDIPAAVVFLASRYACYVTGHSLEVDGGSGLF